MNSLDVLVEMLSEWSGELPEQNAIWSIIWNAAEDEADAFYTDWVAFFENYSDLLLEPLRGFRSIDGFEKAAARIPFGCFVLRIENNPSVDVALVERLLSSKHLDRLSGLSLRCSRFEPGALQVLCASEKLGKVRGVNFSYCHLNDDDAMLVAEATWLQGLCEISLGLNGFRRAPFFEILSGLSMAPLSALFMFEHGYCESFEDIMMLDADFTALGFGGNELTDHSIELLCEHAAVPQLRFLDLYRNHLSDASVEMIARSCENLEYLMLFDNPLTLESAKIIASSPLTSSLKYLLVGPQEVGAEGFRLLRRALPHLQVGRLPRFKTEEYWRWI